MRELGSLHCHVSLLIFTMRHLRSILPLTGNQWGRRASLRHWSNTQVMRGKNNTDRWFVLKQLHFSNLILNVLQVGQKAFSSCSVMVTAKLMDGTNFVAKIEYMFTLYFVTINCLSKNNCKIKIILRIVYYHIFM